MTARCVSRAKRVSLSGRREPAKAASRARWPEPRAGRGERGERAERGGQRGEPRQDGRGGDDRRGRVAVAIAPARTAKRSRRRMAQKALRPSPRQMTLPGDGTPSLQSGEGTEGQRAPGRTAACNRAAAVAVVIATMQPSAARPAETQAAGWRTHRARRAGRRLRGQRRLGAIESGEARTEEGGMPKRDGRGFAAMPSWRAMRGWDRGPRAKA